MPTASRSQSPINGHAYIHGVYIHDRERNSSAIVANVKSLETGESQLHITKDPKYPFWITKKGLQNHKQKKEYAPMYELDKYIYPVHEFPQAVAKSLGMFARGYIKFKDVCDSPYVYGADISPTVMMKFDYRKATQNRLPVNFNVGALDIESSVLGNNEVIACAYVDGKTHQAFCSVLKSFMKDSEEKDLYKMYEAEAPKKFAELTNLQAKKLVAERPYTVTFKVCNTEKELLEWCFARMHDCKPDFCVIWNEDYDIPQIMSRCDFLGIDPKDLFCHPDVPKEYRYIKHRKGVIKKGQHITDAWPWFSTSGYTQFVDAMCLYGRLRKALERESRYTLDFILKKTLGMGKMEFGEYETHFDMQTHAFPRYCVYNVFDSIGTQLQDEVTTDVRNMLNLIAGSDLCDFNKQTVQLKNKFYEYCLLTKNAVPASIGNSVEQPYDNLIHNVGGGVLDPKYCKGVGIAILEEDSQETRMLSFVADIDVGSSYPMNLASRNIGRETKIATVLTLENRHHTDINNIFEMAIDVDENSVKLLSTYFGLPDYLQAMQMLHQRMRGQ